MFPPKNETAKTRNESAARARTRCRQNRAETAAEKNGLLRRPKPTSSLVAPACSVQGRLALGKKPVGKSQARLGHTSSRRVVSSSLSLLLSFSRSRICLFIFPASRFLRDSTVNGCALGDSFRILVLGKLIVFKPGNCCYFGFSYVWGDNCGGWVITSDDDVG